MPTRPGFSPQRRQWGTSVEVTDGIVVWVPASWPAIRRARRARRRALLRRIREDRRPTGGRWYGRRILPADEELALRRALVGTCHWRPVGTP